MAPGLCAVVTVVVAIFVTAFASMLQKWSPIDPAPVDLGPLPTNGFWRPEFNLQNMERIDIGGEGPEDVAFDKQGRAYTGCADGWVKRIDEDGKVTNFSYTGGRPGGLAIRGDPEIMYLADLKLGLFEISLPDGTPHFISNKDDDEGTPMGLADGVAITREGVVYITDASVKCNSDNHFLDILESRPNGRLLKYDPAAKKVSVVKRGFWFANGIALSEGEDYLLISETSRSRVLRLWIRGEKEGTSEVFLDGLPGYPDNIKYYDGNFYIGIVAKRTHMTDWLFKSSIGVHLRRIIPHIPPRIFDLSHSSRTIGRLVVVNSQGQFVRKFEDPTGKVISVVTGGTKYGDFVYLTSLVEPFLGRIKVT